MTFVRLINIEKVMRELSPEKSWFVYNWKRIFRSLPAGTFFNVEYCFLHDTMAATAITKPILIKNPFIIIILPEYRGIILRSCVQQIFVLLKMLPSQAT